VGGGGEVKRSIKQRKVTQGSEPDELVAMQVGGVQAKPVARENAS